MKHSFQGLAICVVLALGTTGCGSSTDVGEEDLYPAFFPLASGNEWHVLITDEQTGQPTVTRRVRYRVVDEAAGGRYNVRITTQTSASGSPPSTGEEDAVWYFDEATGHVRQITHQGEASVTVCPLIAETGAVADCDDGAFGVEASDSVSVGGQMVRTEVKTFRRYFQSQFGYNDTRREFALGIGPTRYHLSWVVVQQHPTQPPTHGQNLNAALHYARISGRIIGQPLF